MISQIKEKFKTDPTGAMREFARGLMKGNRAELKLGYSPANAMLAVRDQLDLDNKQCYLLLAYAMAYNDSLRGAAGEHRLAAIEERPELSEVGLDVMQMADAYDAGTAAVDTDEITLAYPSGADDV
jgi:hypothetical protein